MAREKRETMIGIPLHSSMTGAPFPRLTKISQSLRCLCHCIWNWCAGKNRRIKGKKDWELCRRMFHTGTISSHQAVSQFYIVYPVLTNLCSGVNATSSGFWCLSLVSQKSILSPQIVTLYSTPGELQSMIMNE